MFRAMTRKLSDRCGSVPHQLLPDANMAVPINTTNTTIAVKAQTAHFHGTISTGRNARSLQLISKSVGCIALTQVSLKRLTFELM